MKYYLVIKVSNSFSAVNVFEFNEILIGLFVIIVVLLDIYFRNSF
jgi:hypothetical protein